MPRWARRLYSLPGLPTTDVAATAAGLAFRTGLLVVPDALRAGPHLKDARRRLAALGIRADTHAHEAVFTVAQSRSSRRVSAPTFYVWPKASPVDICLWLRR